MGSRVKHENDGGRGSVGSRVKHENDGRGEGAWVPVSGTRMTEGGGWYHAGGRRDADAALREAANRSERNCAP